MRLDSTEGVSGIISHGHSGPEPLGSYVTFNPGWAGLSVGVDVSGPTVSCASIHPRILCGASDDAVGGEWEEWKSGKLVGVGSGEAESHLGSIVVGRVLLQGVSVSMTVT